MTAKVVWRSACGTLRVEIEDGHAFILRRTAVEEAFRPSAEPASILSPRMAEVFELLRTGKANKEIAQILHIGERVVKYHVSEIFNRLGCTSRAEVIFKYGKRE